MRNKFMAGILAVVLSCCFVACGDGNSNTSSSSVEYADANFMSDLQKALADRWTYADSPEADADYQNSAYGSVEEKDYFQKLVRFELDIFENTDYSILPFKDSKLKEKALAYINCLKDQEDALQYVTVDREKFENLWQEGYGQRTKLIKDFVNDFGLTVDDKFQEDLNGIVYNADQVESEESKQDSIEALVNSLEFNPVEDPYGSSFKTFQTYINNNTGYDIEYLSIDINLLDENGVIIEQEFVSVSNLRNGQTALGEFMTDKNFASMEKMVDMINWAQ